MNTKENVAYQYHGVVVISVAFFLFLNKKIIPACSRHLLPKYQHFTKDQKLEWDMRWTSSVHAVVVSSMSIYEVVFDEEIYRDPIWVNSTVVRTCLAIMTGYLIADFYVMLTEFKQTMEIMTYYFHHAATGFAAYCGYSSGYVAFFANFRILAEIATPFLNQRWFLEVLGYAKTSTAYNINGVLMTFTYLTIRAGSMPFYWYRMYLFYISGDFEAVGFVARVLSSSTAILDVLNVYWSGKLIRGVIKRFTTNHTDKIKD